MESFILYAYLNYIRLIFKNHFFFYFHINIHSEAICYFKYMIVFDEKKNNHFISRLIFLLNVKLHLTQGLLFDILFI